MLFILIFFCVFIPFLFHACQTEVCMLATEKNAKTYAMVLVIVNLEIVLFPCSVLECTISQEAAMAAVGTDGDVPHYIFVIGDRRGSIYIPTYPLSYQHHLRPGHNRRYSCLVACSLLGSH